MGCKDEANHANHICQMKISQKFDEVRELSRNAQFYCKVCDAQSNKEEHLCEPAQFKGKAGALKWR